MGSIYCNLFIHKIPPYFNPILNRKRGALNNDMLQTVASDAKIKIKFVICELFIVPKSCEFVFP